MEKGYIGLYRKIRDWEWYTDTNVKSLFIHLLISSNYQDKNWKGEEIQRGQYLTSVDHLSKETGLSVQQVRTALNKLIKTKEVIKKTTNRYTQLTVVKYKFYQDFDNIGKQFKTNGKQSNSVQLTTTKERKELKKRKEKGKNDIPAFSYLEKEHNERWIEWINEFKTLINEFEKFVLDFNDTVKIEGLDFIPDILFPRLSKYARNWIKNQNKFRNVENSSINNPRKRIDYENEQ